MNNQGEVLADGDPAEIVPHMSEATRALLGGPYGLDESGIDFSFG